MFQRLWTLLQTEAAQRFVYGFQAYSFRVRLTSLSVELAMVGKLIFFGKIFLELFI